MTTWTPVVGSGFDSVANQLAGWDRRNLGVVEGNIARQNAQEQNWNRYNATLDEQAQQDQNLQWQRQAYLNQVAEQHAQEAERRREFDVSLADKRASTQLSAQIAREQIAATSASREDPITARANERNLERGDLMADHGEWLDVNHVHTVFPNIPEGLAQSWVARSRLKQTAVDAEDAGVQAAADELNRYQSAANALSKLGNEPWGWDVFGHQVADYRARKAELERATTGQAKLRYGELRASLTKPNSPLFQALKQQDDGTWIPLTPERPWQRATTTTTNAAPPWAGRWAGAPTAPSPTPTPTPQFGTRVSAPTGAPLADAFGGWSIAVGGASPAQAPQAPTAVGPQVSTSPGQAIRERFPTPDHVRAAVGDGTLTRDQAIEILTTAF